MKVVIDTNVLLVSISSNSKINIITQWIAEGDLQLCVTQDILFEYEEIFERQSGYLGKELLSDIIFDLPNLEFITTYFKWNLIVNDPDDNKFVDCAIASNADFIITEDKHFDVLKNIDFPKVQAISATDFITMQLNLSI